MSTEIYSKNDKSTPCPDCITDTRDILLSRFVSDYMLEVPLIVQNIIDNSYFKYVAASTIPEDLKGEALKNYIIANQTEQAKKDAMIGVTQIKLLISFYNTNEQIVHDIALTRGADVTNNTGLGYMEQLQYLIRFDQRSSTWWDVWLYPKQQPMISYQTKELSLCSPIIISPAPL